MRDKRRTYAALAVLQAALLCVLLPGLVRAEERLVRLHAPKALIETGLLKHILPRFSLKNQIRVEMADDPAAADMVLGEQGTALFQGIGQVWRMELLSPGHLGTERLASWLISKVGQRTIAGFAPDGTAPFGPPVEEAAQAVTLEPDGDALLGRRVSQERCGRCHRVDDERRMAGIGSTPSFAVLRSFEDWKERFSAFYTLNPHPAFTRIEGVTPPFAEDRPSPIVPIELTLDELEAVLAYVGGMKPADLGGTLAHQ